jgi:hypothetical protein
MDPGARTVTDRSEHSALTRVEHSPDAVHIIFNNKHYIFTWIEGNAKTTVSIARFGQSIETRSIIDIKLYGIRYTYVQKL